MVLEMFVICICYRDYNYSYDVYHGVADYSKYSRGDNGDDLASVYCEHCYINSLHNTDGQHS